MLPPAAPTRTPPPRGAPPIAARATLVASPATSPAALAEAIRGATIEGVVAGRDGAGHVLLRTEAGTLALATRLDPPRGARVVLRIDSGAPITATVETVDGRPPAPPPPSRPLAGMANPPGTGEPRAISEPPSTPVPTPTPASASAPAAPSPPAEAARPAVIPAPVVGAIVTATPVAPIAPGTVGGAVQGPRAPSPQASPPPLPASIPTPASTPAPTPASTLAPASPEATPASAVKGRPMAAPTPTPRLAPTAPPIAFRILAITPPDGTAPGIPTPPRARPPRDAMTAPPSAKAAPTPPASPAPGDMPRIPRPIFASPAKPATAGTRAAAPAPTSPSIAPGAPAAPGPGPKTATPAPTIPTPPALATQAASPTATPPTTPAASPATLPTAAPRAEMPPPGAVDARVIGVDATGRPLVETPGGILRLDLARPLDPGARLLLSPVEPETDLPSPAPATTTALLGAGRGWPALRDVMDALRTIAPEAAREVAERAVARPGARMAHTALFFLAALRGGDLAGWLGRETLRRLGDQGRGDLVRRLAGDFAQISRFGPHQGQSQGQPAQGGYWQATMFPVFGGETFDRVRLFVRDNGDGDDAEEDAGGTRFVVELGLSRLGEVQLDGFLR